MFMPGKIGSSQNIYGRIGFCCTTALGDEVAASPKPGLVDRINSGAHTDMNYFTFIKSIQAISPFFSVFAEMGSNFECIDAATLAKIRPLGVECEKAMFKATEGVNTHKGAIFSLSILATAAGFCYKSLHCLFSDTVCNTAAVIAKESGKDFEADGCAGTLTKGLKIFNAYGIRGVRGEAASGFYSARKYGLPVIKKLSKQGYCKNDIYMQALLNLIANVTDTNVISRCGIRMVNWVQAEAREALRRGGALTPSGRRNLTALDGKFTENNVSPGGCADLLSVTILLYMLEKIL